MATSEFDEYFALRKKGEFREAYGVLRDVMQKNPRWSSSGDLYVWCADLEMLVNDDAHKALELLEKARELGYHYPARYHNTRGFVRWRMGERDEGIRELEKSVELEPSADHLVILGKVLSTEEDGRATGVWERVLEQDRQNCVAHVYLGMLAFKHGDRGKAVVLAKRAERLAKSATDHIEIGRLYQELGEFQSAVDSYLRACRLGGEMKGSLYAAVAACYFSLGDNETARKYLKWAMRRDPEHEYVKYVYGQSRDLMGDE